MKILAIDFGMKRMGFAIGSPLLRTAVPIAPIIRKDSQQMVAEIAGLVEEYDITTIIMGYPLNMDGTKSEITQQVEHFANRLRKKFAMDVLLVDERLSSFEADEVLKTHHTYQRDYKKRKKIMDSIAATVILNAYMERQLHTQPAAIDTDSEPGETS